MLGLRMHRCTQANIAQMPAELWWLDIGVPCVKGLGVPYPHCSPGRPRAMGMVWVFRSSLSNRFIFHYLKLLSEPEMSFSLTQAMQKALGKGWA